MDEQTVVNIAEIWLDGLPPSPNRTRGAHWSQLYKSQQEWKRNAWILAKAAYRGDPLERAHLHYHISVGTKRIMDADNIISSLKPIQDGIKGVLVTDDNIDVVEVSYSFDREKPRGVLLTVSSLPKP